MIDLRSDTVTKPSKEMLQAMYEAEVEMMFMEKTLPLINWKKSSQNSWVKIELFL